MFWAVLHKAEANTDNKLASLVLELAAYLWPYSFFMIRNLESTVLVVLG